MKEIKVIKGIIDGKERLKLFFPYDREIIARVKTIPGARWSPRGALLACFGAGRAGGEAEQAFFRHD
jgi:hypothetical protein